MRRLVTLDQTRHREGVACWSRRVASFVQTRAASGAGPLAWRIMLVLLALVVALLITGKWFVPGRLLAGGDNFPPYTIDPGKWVGRMRYAWDLGGAGGPSSLIQALPQIVFDALLRAVSAPAEAQRAFYVLLYGAQFLSMSYFVLTVLPGHRVATIVAALFYCFNPFIVLVPPGYLGLFILVYLPYMSALFIRLATGSLNSVSLAIFAVSASLSGMLFVNPPLFMVFLLYALSVSLYIVAHAWRGKVLLHVALLMTIYVLVNVYWISQAYFVLFGAGHQQVIAAPAQDWSFVARRSSILNMFWLNPTWAWTYYFPYAPVYKTPLLLVTVFLPSLIAFSALLNRSIPRWIVVPAAAGSLVLLLVSTGLHGPDPFYNANQFFFHHVPLFWLFREPDTKFPFPLLVLYAPLIGYQIECLAGQLAHALRRRWVGVMLVKSCVLAVTGLAFIVTAFPLVTGQVVGRSPGVTVPPGIAIPSYWFQLKDYLSRQDVHAEVLLLPNDDYYQMRYSWGYYGADAVPGEFIPNRTITINAAGGYVAATSGGVDLNGQILQAVKDSAHPTIEPYLAAQGMRYIVQRNDIVTDEIGRHIVSPRQVRSYLQTQSYLHFVRSFGKLDLYEVDQRSFVPILYAVAAPPIVMSKYGQVKLQNDYLLLVLGAPSRTHGKMLQPAASPHVMRWSWHQVNSVRFTVQIDRTTQPVLLVLSTIYNPNWHVCVVPTGTPIWPWTCWFNGFLSPRVHLSPFGLFNGWLIDPGPASRYTVIVDFGVQHITDLAALVSFLTAAGITAAAVLVMSVKVVRASKNPEQLPRAFE